MLKWDVFLSWNAVLSLSSPSRPLYSSFPSVCCLRCVWEEGLVRWSWDVEEMQAEPSITYLTCMPEIELVSSAIQSAWFFRGVCTVLAFCSSPTTHFHRSSSCLNNTSLFSFSPSLVKSFIASYPVWYLSFALSPFAAFSFCLSFSPYSSTVAYMLWLFFGAMVN